MNSRQKGKRGELEFVHFLKARGIDARRGQQYCGTSGDADVVAENPLEECHIEVKRREAGNPYDWVKQAQRDAAPRGQYPIVAHKRNGEEWIIILPACCFIDIMTRLYNAE